MHDDPIEHKIILWEHRALFHNGDHPAVCLHEYFVLMGHLLQIVLLAASEVGPHTPQSVILWYNSRRKHFMFQMCSMWHALLSLFFKFGTQYTK